MSVPSLLLCLHYESFWLFERTFHCHVFYASYNYLDHVLCALFCSMTWPAVVWKSQKGDHPVLSYLTPQGDYYSFQHKRTNKTCTVYECAACISISRTGTAKAKVLSACRFSFSVFPLRRFSSNPEPHFSQTRHQGIMQSASLYRMLEQSRKYLSLFCHFLDELFHLLISGAGRRLSWERKLRSLSIHQRSLLPRHWHLPEPTMESWGGYMRRMMIESQRTE